MIHVVVDEPQGFPSSVPAVWEATSPDLAIMRLHGRNRATWAKKGISAAERFNYLYSEEELRELAGSVTGLGEYAKELHVLFNNCYRDNAQRNALMLQGLMNPLEKDVFRSGVHLLSRREFQPCISTSTVLATSTSRAAAMMPT